MASAPTFGTYQRLCIGAVSGGGADHLFQIQVRTVHSIPHLLRDGIRFSNTRQIKVWLGARVWTIPHKFSMDKYDCVMCMVLEEEIN